MKQVQIRFAGDNKYIKKRRGILPVFGYQGQFFIADVTGGRGRDGHECTAQPAV